MVRRALRARRRRAVAAVQFAVATPVMIGFATLVVDVGALYNTRAALQRAADSGALAAIGVVADNDASDASIPIATQAAVDYVAANPVMGQTLAIEPDLDVIFGRAHFDPLTNAYNFVPGEVPINAVRTIVRHTEDSPNGAVPLYFAPIFGKSATNVTAEAVAIYVNTSFVVTDCYSAVGPNEVVLCHVEGDSDDSDDSASGASDDSDDSDSGDSDGADSGDSDDSDDSDAGDSDDSDDSGDSEDSVDSGDSWDSEGVLDSDDSDSPLTILADSGATGFFLAAGDTVGPCDCPIGDSDDSDDSQGVFGLPDSGDSDDSDSGDSDGSENGDSDDSDDSQGVFGLPDSDDSDDSDSGDSDGSTDGDSDDSDDSASGASDDSDDSDPGDLDDSDPEDSDDSDSDDSDGGWDSDSGDSENTDENGVPQVTICHIPPGNPENAHTITVGEPSVPAHEAHGDILGTCPEGINRTWRIFLIE